MHADTSALFKHPGRISPLRLAVALFGAPVAWIAQLSLDEPLTSLSCYPHHVPLPEPLWPWLTVMLAAINGVCLAAGLLSGFVAWRLCRQTGVDLMQDREGRTPFLVKLGVMSSFIFIMALLFTGCSVLLVSPCQPWF